nr:MAG TPA: hypothetical protein [Bacteriophage sp.]
MRTLVDVITESTVFNQLEGDKEEAKRLLQSILRSDDFNRALDIIYQHWEEDGSKEIYTPVRYTGDRKKVKIARKFAEEDCAADLIQAGYAIQGGFLKFGKNKVVFGNGSPRGVRAARGLELEHDLLIDIKQAILHRMTGEWASREDLAVPGNPNYTKKGTILHPHVESAPFLDRVIAGLNTISVDGTATTVDEVNSIVLLTGSGDTKRNRDGWIFDKNLVVNKDFTGSESAKVIADITVEIPGKTPVYISCKMDTAQLSGISVNFMNTSDWDKDKAFGNFFTTFGINPESVADWYRNGDGSKFTEEITGNPDMTSLGCLMAKLIGGDYVYLTPTKCIEVPSEKEMATSIARNMRPTRYRISAGAGKTIMIDYKIGSLGVAFEFRTDGKGGRKYPYRLFPKVQVAKLLENL